MKTTEVETV